MKRTFVKSMPSLLLAVFLFGIACSGKNPVEPTRPEVTPLNTAQFEERLQNLAAQYRIPGMAGAIGRNGEAVWSRGFGEANVAQHLPATSNTAFHLASLTKTFASVVVLQLVEEGKLDLEDSVAKYGVALPNAAEVKIWHLLSHTSEGVPGTQYRYNGARFAKLDQVLLAAVGRPFTNLVAERVIKPLGLRYTGPGDLKLAFAAGLDTVALRSALAQGYSSDGKQAIPYPTYVGTSAGLISSTQDMLAYSWAWDEDRFLKPETKTRAFSPIRTAQGQTLPYALGWFVTEYNGEALVWHYGYDTAISSLLIKVPARKITFVLLANSDQLSARFGLGVGDLLSSPFARAFLGWLAAGS